MEMVATKGLSETTNPNQAAISNQPIEQTDIGAIVRKVANRQSKNGVIIQATDCNRSKLFSGVCAEIKSRNGQEKTGRLLPELADKVNEAIDNFLVSIIREITPSNITSHNRTYRHSQSDMAVFEQVTIRGRNVLDGQRQLYGIGQLIKQAEKRLASMTLNYADREAIENAEKTILRLNTTKEHISAQLEKLKQTV